MKMKWLMYPVLGVLSVSIFTGAVTDSTGIAGYTGSPGETDCTNSGCHDDFKVNSGTGSIVIGSNIPASGYVAGTTYQMNVKVAQASSSLFGFDLEALNSANANAGTLAVSSATETQVRTTKNKNNIFHKKLSATSSGSHTFTFNWTAPAASTGTVTFYAAGNAANANGKETGDYIYKTSLAVTPSTIAGIDDAQKSLKISLSPNPAKDKITVQYFQTQSGEVTFALYDSKGTMAHPFGTVFVSAGDQSREFNIPSTLQPGIYFFRATGSEGLKAEMIVLE